MGVIIIAGTTPPIECKLRLAVSSLLYSTPATYRHCSRRQQRRSLELLASENGKTHLALPVDTRCKSSPVGR